MQTRKSRWRKRGGTEILFLIVVPVLLGAAALTLDVGSIYITKQKLQNRVDAAALAAGPELPNQKSAKEECLKCAEENGLNTSDAHLSIRVLNGQGQAVDGNDNNTARQLEVKAIEDVPMTFARIFGYSKWPVGALAAVAMDEEPVNVVTRNSTPFGIDKDLYSAVNDVSVVVFPCKANDEKQQLWIVPGELWAKEIRKLLADGNPTKMAVGDHMTVNPNITPEFVTAITKGITDLVKQADRSEEFSDPNNTSPNNPRILTIPLVQKLDGGPDGYTTHNVEVVGFASFYVVDMQGSNIRGHFVDTGSADGHVEDNKPPSQATQKGKIVPVHLIK